MKTSLFQTSLGWLSHPRLKIGKRSYSTYLLCGVAGILLTIPQSWLLVRHGPQSWLIALLILVSCVVACLCLVMLTKILTGNETLTYYHHAICAAAVTFLLLRLMGQPVMPYLDLTVLGVGLILACGRVGCLMVGCCHGRAWRWGIQYRREHMQAGFAPYLVGVTLFPLQALESIFVLGLVGIGMTLVLHQQPAGSALTFYIVSYALGRFWIEFARGDAQRVYFLGFSQAQWTSLVVTATISYGEDLRILPRAGWHVWISIFILASMIVIALSRRLRKNSGFKLCHPRHVRELAGAVQLAIAAGHDPVNHTSECALKSGASAIHLIHTSLGIQISSSKIIEGNRFLRQYTLSGTNGFLNPDLAKRLAVLIARLTRASTPFQLLPGNSGVVHVLVETERGSSNS
jgi:prolipoprotein diacylglyceryltransferase